MMKGILLLVFSFNLQAVTNHFDSCGVYKVFGKYEKNKDQINLIINQYTYNEGRYLINADSSFKGLPFLKFKSLSEVEVTHLNPLKLNLLHISSDPDVQIYPDEKVGVFKLKNGKCEK
jgi:hypothetical protein